MANIQNGLFRFLPPKEDVNKFLQRSIPSVMDEEQKVIHSAIGIHLCFGKDMSHCLFHIDNLLFVCLCWVTTICTMIRKL